MALSSFIFTFPKAKAIALIAGLMTPAQMEAFRTAMNVRPGKEWEPFEGLAVPEAELRAYLKRVPPAE